MRCRDINQATSHPETLEDEPKDFGEKNPPATASLRDRIAHFTWYVRTFVLGFSLWSKNLGSVVYSYDPTLMLYH